MKFDINVDGACRGNPGPSSVGVLIRDPEGKTIEEYGRFIGETTNNVAEYTAVLEALRLARGLGGTELRILSDSQLMVRQLSGVYRVKNERLQRLWARVDALRKPFESVVFLHVPREQNRDADRLANEALDQAKRAKLYI